MTVTIDFTPEEEAWLNAQTQRQGLSPAEVIKKLVDQHIPAPNGTHDVPEETTLGIEAKNAAAIALLDSWIIEGANADLETKRQAEQELEEFKRNMNANRAATGERRVFA
jgi:hypothetical protein